MIRSQTARKIFIPKHVFRISRASRTQVDNVFFAVEQGGTFGYGEASPNSFFNENASDVEMRLLALSDYLRRQTLVTIEDIQRIWQEIWERVAPSRACQCAVDLALWDLWGKLNQQSVIELALGTYAFDVLTSATLGICPREEWDQRISDLKEFKTIKVKMDSTPNLDLLKAIRKQSSATIRVDANGAWSALDIPKLSGQMADLGVEFIEQPLPPSEDERMTRILLESKLPILADESCVGLEHIPNLVGRFSGFNIKLVKCGGITPAMNMIKLGRQLGLKTMVGCMLESSLLISAGTVVAQGADFADLDGSWLIQNDPFDGLEYKGGKIKATHGSGLGITLRQSDL